MSKKKVYASHVSRTLAVAGFERADAETTSIRGHYRYSPGYQVFGGRQSWEHGYTDDPASAMVTVSHQTLNSFEYGEKDPRPHAVIVEEALAQYATALEAAGYDVLDGLRRNQTKFLIVTARVT